MISRPLASQCFVWAIVATGVLVPVLVGLAVRQHLMGLGDAVLPMPRALMLLLMAFVVEFPIWLFAWFANLYLRSAHAGLSGGYRKRALIVGMGMLFSLPVTVMTFWVAFQRHGDLAFFGAPLWIGGGVLAGLAFGAFVSTAIKR